jgi:hypothetical protein
MRILRVMFLSFTVAIAAGAQIPAATEPAGTPVAGAPAVSAVLILRNSLTSKNATEGKEVKAELEKAIVLPGGQTLPKYTMVFGRIAQVSQHSKGKPNGALLLVFDMARVKGKDPVPVIVQISKLMPSAAAENNTQTMPGSTGGRIGGTGNSGGTQQLQFEREDKSTLAGNNKQSDIAGIYLRNNAGGSGTVFALGEDVDLDQDIRMNVLIAQGQPKTN